MDPSIMKLLEEDEDESMHSGADVDAFQAALNRDLGGGRGGDGVNLSQLQSSDSGSAVLAQGGCSSSTQSFHQWQTSTQDEKPELQSQEENQSGQGSEQNSSHMLSNQQGSDFTNQQQKTNIPYPLPKSQSQENFEQRQGEQISNQIAQSSAMQIPHQDPVSVREPKRTQNPDSETQYINMQRMSNQQASISEQAGSTINKSKQVPFALLLPLIMPQLDKDRAMQLQALYTKLKKNEIPRDAFVRHMRSIAGDQMLRLAVMKSQRQHSGSGHSLPPTQQQHARILPGREMEQQSDSKGTPIIQMPSSISGAVNQGKEQSTVPLQGQNKQQQYHFPQTSFPVSGGSTSGVYYSYSGPNVNPSSSTLKQQSHESQMRQTPLHHGTGLPQLGGATHAMNISGYEKPSSINDPKRIQGGVEAHFSNNATTRQNSIPHYGHLSVNSVKQEPVDQSNEKQNKPHLPVPHGFPSFSSAKDETFDRQPPHSGFPATSSIIPCNSASSSVTSQLDPNTTLGSRMPTVPSSSGIIARTMPKKPAVGQKKPLEVPDSSPPPSSKKQKVSGALLDQSIDQLNDVTAVSGVNLREEEEQLFSGNKEDSRASEALRRVVQEEEEKFILQKIPLQKKLAEIMAKFGLKNLSNDVERCLSLSVEERLRGIICNVIRVSKQRVDVEKPRHQTIITSDVRRQIMSINKKAREEWEKKQTEVDKGGRLNDPDSNNEIGGEKEKDENRGKSNKANKEVDEKTRATAANVAARAAVGGDDMFSKWQLMAEQNRQKREGGTVAASSSHSHNNSFSKNIKENQDSERKGHAASVTASGTKRKFGRNPAGVPQSRVARTLSVKDVITVLQREPQMSKSTLTYRLYDRIRSDAGAE